MTILPALMQLVQTRMRLLPPSTLALTAWRFGFQRRRVVLWAWEMLFPNCGPLPQSSHFCAMAASNLFRAGVFPPGLVCCDRSPGLEATGGGRIRATALSASISIVPAEVRGDKVCVERAVYHVPCFVPQP